MKYTNKIEKYLNEGKKAATAYNQMNKAVTTAIYGIKNMRKLIDDAPYNSKLGTISANLYKFEVDLEKKLRTFIPQIRVIANSKMLESVNEARSTNTEWNKFEKAFGDFFKTVLRLGKANTKLTGNKTDEKIMIKNFNRDVGKFYSLMQSWVRGQNESTDEGQTQSIGGEELMKYLMKRFKMNKLNPKVLTRVIEKLWSRVKLKLPI